MKIYCVTVEYGYYDCYWIENLYVGYELSSAIKQAQNIPISSYDIESILIEVWEDGTRTNTLDGNGEERDWEN